MIGMLSRSRRSAGPAFGEQSNVFARLVEAGKMMQYLHKPDSCLQHEMLIAQRCGDAAA
jgi:hypothetical protein